MIKLYELLAKVGTNPQLRAWAMKQLKKVNPLRSKPKPKSNRLSDQDFVADLKKKQDALKKKHGLDPESLKKDEEAFKLRLQEILAKHSTKHADGGRIGFDDGGSTQKEIDKGIAAIEKLKPGLMPESYKALIELYKKKQKDLHRGIMESAGGLGEMLGEGGRIGMEEGGEPSQIGHLIIDFIVEHGRQPKPSEVLQLEEKIRIESKAKGGRIGFQEGTGVMSQTGIPYYADKAVEGIVNSAETLSKLPFAGGELISKLLRQKPTKKMFSEAIENITPGSWSENLGISSLAEAEGAKVSGKQRAIGDILGLGTEMAAPVGGAFKIGQNLISQASKVFGKLKKGKTLDQTINDKITDFGQSRRDFNILAGTSGLMVALKAIGLGGFLKSTTKATKDISVKLKSWIDDSDEMTEWGPQAVGRWAGNFDISSLTPKGIVILKKLFGKNVQTVKDKAGKITARMDDVATDDAAMYVDDIIKKGKGGIDFKYVDDIVGGTGSVDATLARYAKTFGKNSKTYKDLLKKSKKMSEKQKILYELDDTGADEWVDDVVGLIYPGKAAGGPVGLPPEVFGPPAPKKKIPSPILKPPTDRPDEGPRPKDPFYDRPHWQWGVGFGTKAGPEHVPGTILSEDRGGIRSVKPDLSDPRLQLERHNPGQPSKFGINIGKDNVGFKYIRKFDQGGIARRPNAVPPLSGPTPQGLTFLLGDDIVKNRIT